MFFLRSPRREIAAAVHGAAARTDRMPVGRGLEDGLHCLEGALVKERKGEEDLVARTGGIFSWSGSTSWAGSRAARRWGGLSTARGRAGVLPGQPVNGQRTEQLQ